MNDQLYLDFLFCAMFLCLIAFFCLLVFCVQPWFEQCRRSAEIVNDDEV